MTTATHTPTYKVAHCKVCGSQWQVWGNPPANADACQFCGAGNNGKGKAITIEDESLDYSQGADNRRRHCRR